MNAHVVSPLVRAPLTMLGPEPVIVTGSVTLRPHRLADADAIAASLSDGRVSSMLARVPAPYFRQDALDWLVPVTSGLLPGWRLAVTCGDDTHLGSVSIEPRGGRWELGYWVNRFFWSRGIGRAAVHAALDRFFRRMPEAEVDASIFADNPASLELARKLGFEVTGCEEVYSAGRASMVMAITLTLDAAGLTRP
ncbi:Protein N-acetyltransferase, RimJ/RimL family [Rhizobium sp. RU20A]|uniref:GNAT family N-acetyltransferase n=1 Tax=Rhizobium sp. RU20A TaxID=1907412 RepID=UPI000954B2DF|nr:GNAT family N-acetyltransferase [Rhizobium sp. RU20A]SIQ87082.1 Protein N-acetyltransferase, RimJ/RimL family [Rhizobium sp. RU20A]